MKRNTALRKLRETLGLSQAELGRRVGISNVQISLTERGHRPCSKRLGLSVVKKYRREMAIANVTLEDLLRGGRHADTSQ